MLIEFFNNNLKCIVTLFLLNMPQLFQTYNLIGKVHSNFSSAFGIIFGFALSTFIQVTILFFIINWLPKIFQWLVLIVSGILFVIDCFTLYNYNSTLNKAMIQVIMETNVNESIGYLSTHARWEMLICILVVVFLLILLIKLCSTIFDWLIKNMLHFLRMLILIFVFSVSIPISYVYKNESLDILTNNISVSRFGILISESVTEITEYKKIYDNIKSAEIKLTYNNGDIPYVVFILGESTQRWHMQIYDYNLPTTPNLQRRFDNGEIALFTDVISSQSVTTLSMQRIFTFFNNENPEPWYMYSNLFDILQGGGGIVLCGFLIRKLPAFMAMLQELMLIVVASRNLRL